MDSRFPENWREILAKNILIERVRLELSQSKLVKELNEKQISITNIGTVSVWENGKGRFNLDVIDALCRIFNRTPQELMYEDLSFKPPNPSPPKNGKPTAQDEARISLINSVLDNMGQGGASKASESPPPKTAEQQKIQEMKKQMLEMMMKLEEMTQ